MAKKKDQDANGRESPEDGRSSPLPKFISQPAEFVTQASRKVKKKATEEIEKVKVKAGEIKREIKRRKDIVSDQIQSEGRRIITGDGNKRVRDFVDEKRRKFITGDGNKRVREFLLEKPVIKFTDKMAFMFGVIMVNVTQHTLTNHPTEFGTWFCCVMTPMMIWRYFVFKKKKWIYFMHDFCYWPNAAVLVAVMFRQQSELLMRLIFVLGNGPLLLAIVIWRNNFVFHDLEQVTSVMLHAFPALVSYTWRWHSPGKEIMCPEGFDECTMPWSWMLTQPVAAYTAWQIYYYYVTEVRDKEILDNDPKQMSSIRWLSKRGEKNGMGWLVLQVCRKLGVFRADETYDSTTLKTRIVFMNGQFFYTFFAMLPTYFMFHNQTVHALTLLIIYIISIWNGAGFYIEVFSAQYLKQFEIALKKGGVASKAAEEEEEEDAKAGAGDGSACAKGCCGDGGGSCADPQLESSSTGGCSDDDDDDDDEAAGGWNEVEDSSAVSMPNAEMVVEEVD